MANHCGPVVVQLLSKAEIEQESLNANRNNFWAHYLGKRMHHIGFDVEAGVVKDCGFISSNKHIS